LTRYKVTLAYDGTDFEGWQSQARVHPVRTVQDTLEKALGKLGGGERVAVFGAGRTDTGVHALGQVVSFDLAREMTAADLGRALNGLLPPDVRIVGAQVVPPTFHARKDALSKLYRYTLDAGPVCLPARRRHAGWVPGPLDEARMAEVARLFVGRHDFAALASAGGSVKTTTRTVARATLVSEPLAGADGRTFVYEVEADGFLRKMVRSMVGGLIAAGRGVATPAALADALHAKSRRGWPAPAPACGLTLVRVDYPPAADRVVT